ncbi:MAG TPA: glycoside hydrolase family 130 protein [bacterium]|jgi:beta-1,4-mannooligosaccharide/beta-1,4-mannosyl-N-acetylglucosamine phosphorylase
MRRWPKNPILTRNSIPSLSPHLVDVSSVFNPGAVLFNGQVLLMLRVQNRGRETFFLTARSTNGHDFTVSPRMVHFRGLEQVKETIFHCYDARITRLGDDYFILFAMDMEDGCRLGLAKTVDFESFDFLGICSENDNRNGVLFPEQIGGRFLRLDRPNRVQLAGGPVSGSAICLSESDDLLHWKPVAPLLDGRFHYWDELIGAGPPPIKTREGWLCIYHGVATHFASSNIYQAGVFLLDLHDPSKLLARSRYNILEPREPYELTGQVPNVVFPSGAIVKHADTEGFADPSSEVLVYYGAADTAVGLAVTTIEELLSDARMA